MMKPYFEGWYLKHQNKNFTIAFIPSFHRAPDGTKSAMLQIITPEGSHMLTYPAAALHICKKPFSVRLAGNIFSGKGIRIRINAKDINICGRLRYAPFLPLCYDIMGPFSLLPNLQCNHGILSLSHRLYGSLSINGKPYDFTGGTGYIEKDWGHSFPSSYLWTQCNWYDQSDCCIMVSAADIPVPFTKHSFTGCICAISYRGHEYRLATYLGVKILRYTEKELLLQQGHYRLCVRLIASDAHDLKAPVSGLMNRIIRESPSCTVRYQFWHKNCLVFDLTSRQAGFEYAES